MSDPVGIAMIGTGMWAKRLVTALKRTPELNLVTCYSRNEGNRNEFAAAHGCEAANSFVEAITHPDVQGVLLLTPNGTHAEQTAACAEHGKHVFVEKPIADTLVDGHFMQTTSQNAGITLLVGHAFRRLGAARKVKQLLDEEALGRVVLAEANFSLPSRLTPDKWRYYRDTCPGGPLMQLGVHHADTLQYWLGPAQQVMGSFARLATDAEIDDIGSVQIEFKSGAKGVLNSSYVSPKTFYLRLYGTEANLSYETDMNVWPQADKMDAATTLTLQTKSDRQVIQFEERDMLVEELEEFARCVRGETTPETDAEAGLQALQIIRGAIASHENGQPHVIGD